MRRTPRRCIRRAGREEERMPITTKYLFVASMDVDPDKEDLFNEVYDTEHVPNLLTVPGVHAVTRVKGEPFAVSIGGAEQQVVHVGPRYSALYEIDGPHVLVSAAGRPCIFELAPSGACITPPALRVIHDLPPSSERRGAYVRST